MFAKKIIYLLLFVVGVFLLGLSLPFLLHPDSSLMMTFFILASMGVASLIFGSGMKASVKKNMPSMIDADMMRLASRSDGRVTADMAVADLHITKAQALESLDRLSSAGTARPDMTDNGVAYIFDQVKPKRKIRKCSYCGAQYPVSKPITKCENCGGEVKLVEQ